MLQVDFLADIGLVLLLMQLTLLMFSIGLISKCLRSKPCTRINPICLTSHLLEQNARFMSVQSSEMIVNLMLEEYRESL